MIQEPDVTGVVWRRAHITGAGISIDQHPDWATLHEEQLVYQRFSSAGTVSVQWGPKATMEHILAEAGLGSGGSTREIQSDESVTINGIPARCVQICVTAPRAVSHSANPPDPDRIMVFYELTVGDRPVLVGYRAPRSELAAFTSLLEHIVRSVWPA